LSKNIAFGNVVKTVVIGAVKMCSLFNKKAFEVYAEINFTKDISLRNQFNYDFVNLNNSAFQPNNI